MKNNTQNLSLEKHKIIIEARYSFLEKLLKERNDTVYKLSIETSTLRIIQLSEAVKSIDKTIAEWNKE